jgi:hypothetical protein
LNLPFLAEYQKMANEYVGFAKDINIFITTNAEKIGQFWSEVKQP